VRTGQVVLALAFERLLPEIRDLVDVPPEMRRAGRRLRDALAGRWDPPVEEWDLEDQARLAVPLMNYMRLLAERHGGSPPDRARGRSRRAAALMLRMDPAVAWVAIRNSMAYEASNRPTQGGREYDWMRLWMPHVRAVREWLDVYRRIRAEVLS